VHDRLLPATLPNIQGLELAAASLTCTEAGGDFFDVIPEAHGSPSRTALLVGDVSGHGLDAALLMATARGVLREHLQRSDSLAGAVAAANATLYGDFLATGRFMTMFLLCLDPASGTMAWVRAGHDPALVYYPEEDRFLALEGRGMPLGVLEAPPCEADNQAPLAKSCLVAIGTDGIWEARDLAGEMFGKERFKELPRASAHLPAGQIVAAVYEEVFRHTRGVKLQDDVTLVIVKFNPPPGHPGQSVEAALAAGI